MQQNPSSRAWHRSVLAIAAVLLPVALGCQRAPQLADVPVLCRSSTGQRSARPVHQWKFDQLRNMVLTALPSDATATYKELRRKIDADLNTAMRDSLGAYENDLRLVIDELEVRRELECVERTKDGRPVQVRLVPPAAVSQSH